ncbi:restriction endonuclease subunit S [Moraxella osloensis]|nr:restriction endonuclease subunit S [Moraxella osloensis]MBL7667009.1 restriction endonuclease subunit S [Moraxella osloensis]
MGMKQTEIGEIPEDWDFVKLNQVANFGGGTTPARKNYARYYLHGKHNWVKTLDLNNSFIYKTSEQITDEALEETSLKKHPKESVLVAMYGGFNQIGRTGLLKVDASINQALVAILPKSDILNSEYLLFNLNFNVNYWKSVASSSRKDPNITSQDVKNYPIAFSKNLDEQKEIAQVLTDTDNLIQATEQLIHKKQLIKTATMQNLLTGKIRLAEFDTKKTKPSELGEIPNDWDVRKIGDYSESFSGGTPLTSIKEYYNGSIKWITSSDLNQSFIKEVKGRISQLGLENSSAKKVKKDTLLIALYGATAGVTAITKVDGTINQAVLALIPKIDDSLFLFYWFTLSKKTIIDTYTQGGQPNLSGDIIRSISISLPSLPEQKAISTMLMDMDEELKTLKERLTKLNDIKQGLMQNLLTGKIRLTE